MEFWLIMIAFIVMGGSCSLAGTWWDRKNKKGMSKMFNLVYKSVVVECSTGVEDLAKAIEKKSEEMLNKGYKLVTMSMVGTDKIIAITQQSRMRISFKQICRVRFETTGSK